MKKARMVEVIETTVVEGEGTEKDPARLTTSYWTKEGAFIGTMKAQTTVKMESIYGGDERVGLLGEAIVSGKMTVNQARERLGLPRNNDKISDEHLMSDKSYKSPDSDC